MMKGKIADWKVRVIITFQSDYYEISNQKEEDTSLFDMLILIGKERVQGER